jgi:hypothetical protein
MCMRQSVLESTALLPISPRESVYPQVNAFGANALRIWDRIDVLVVLDD